MNKIFLMLALFLLSNLSFGQEHQNEGNSQREYEKTLKEMLLVSGAQETFKATIEQIFLMFEGEMAGNTEMMKNLKNEFRQSSLNDLITILVPIYRKYLTEEDLKEVIKFYKTPVGQKLGKNTPFITQDSMQAGQEWGIKIFQKVEEKMKAYEEENNNKEGEEKGEN